MNSRHVDRPRQSEADPAADVAARDGVAFIASGKATLMVVSALEPPEIFRRSTFPRAGTRRSLIGELLFCATGETGVSVYSCADPRPAWPCLPRSPVVESMDRDRLGPGGTQPVEVRP